MLEDLLAHLRPCFLELPQKKALEEHLHTSRGGRGRNLGLPSHPHVEAPQVPAKPPLAGSLLAGMGCCE